jgi:hypothetical protein
MMRNVKDLRGYAIRATDGVIGTVDDFYFDDEDWRWIDDVSWSTATVSVGLTRHAIKGAPPYDSEAQLDRQREQALHVPYDRPGCWIVPTRSRQSERLARRAIARWENEGGHT